MDAGGRQRQGQAGYRLMRAPPAQVLEYSGPGAEGAGVKTPCAGNDWVLTSSVSLITGG